MNAGYAEEVRARCPEAQIVYDLFHVVAKHGREVIDRVRVDEANRLRQDRPARQLKGRDINRLQVPPFDCRVNDGSATLGMLW